MRRAGKLSAGALLPVVVWTLTAAGDVAASRPNSGGHLRLGLKSAVPGAALDLSGRGLAGKRTKVTVGGRKAKVLEGTKKRVRIVVPKVSPGTKKVVARAGKRILSGKLVVLRPFDGTVAVTPDRTRSASAVIGTGGGTITAKGANGVSYTLEVPAGALPADTNITVTPAAKFGRLPLTGGSAAGVTFAPEHLELALPATLRITYPSKPPAHPLGFTFDSATGKAFEITSAARSGKTLSVPIEHFSSGGASGSTEADLANFVQRFLNQAEPLRGDQIDHVLDTIDHFKEFDVLCAAQPICIDLLTRIVAEMLAAPPVDQSQYTCNKSAGNEEIRRLLIAEERFTRALGSGASIAHLETCRHDIIEQEIKSVSCGGADDPLAAFPEPFKGADLATADANHDGLVSHAEAALYWSVEAAKEGFGELDTAAKEKFRQCIVNARDIASNKCNDDRDAALKLLNTGENIWLAAPFDLATTFDDAKKNCRPTISVAPAQSAVGPGAKVALTTTSNAPGEVLWNASAGSIGTTGTFNQNATYTAPSTPGVYEVTATLAAFQDVHAVAKITVSRVVITSRHSDISTKAIGSFDGTDHDPVVQSFQGIGQFPFDVQQSFQSPCPSSAHATGVDDVGVADGELSISVTPHLVADYAGTNIQCKGQAEARNELTVEFSLGSFMQYSCSLSSTGSVSDGGGGTLLVDETMLLYQASNLQAPVSNCSTTPQSQTSSQTVFVAAGNYVLKLVGRCFDRGLGTCDVSYTATASTKP